MYYEIFELVKNAIKFQLLKYAITREISFDFFALKFEKSEGLVQKVKGQVDGHLIAIDKFQCLDPWPVKRKRFFHFYVQISLFLIS